MGHPLIHKAPFNIAGGFKGRWQLAGDFRFFLDAFGGVGQKIKGIPGRHEAGPSQSQGHPAGIDGDPAPPPLFGHKGGGAAAAVMDGADFGKEGMNSLYLQIIDVILKVCDFQVNDITGKTSKLKKYHISRSQVFSQSPLLIRLFLQNRLSAGLIHGFQDTFQVNHNFRGWEPQDPQPQGKYVFIPLPVVSLSLRLKMAVAVNLYDQTGPAGIKISNIRADGVLLPVFYSSWSSAQI